MKKRKLTLFFSFLIVFFSVGFGQRLEPTVIASDGGVARAPSITLEWTLGETAVESVSSAQRFYTQGFHQPLLWVSKRSTVKTPTVTDQSIGIHVVPNPVRSILQVRLDVKLWPHASFVLSDLHGKVMTSAQLDRSSVYEIDMTRMPAGLYILHVKSTADHVSSFKIVKLH